MCTIVSDFSLKLLLVSAVCVEIRIIAFQFVSFFHCCLIIVTAVSCSPVLQAASAVTYSSYSSVAITTLGPLPQLVPPYFWNVLPPSTNSIKFLLVSPPPPLLFSKSISSLGALLTGGSAYEPLTLTEALYKF